jgi:hypothetical protein
MLENRMKDYDNEENKITMLAEKAVLINLINV